MMDEEKSVTVKPVVRVVDKKEEVIHLDDFLNIVHDRVLRSEAKIHVEINSAFAKFALAKGWVKKTASEWEKDFEKFSNATP